MGSRCSKIAAPPDSTDLPGDACASDVDNLHKLVEKGDKSGLMSYIDRGGDVNLLSDKQQTSLHVAAFEGFDEVIALLLSVEAHVDARNPKGVTPLHLACKFGHIEAAKVLLLRGADPLLKTNAGRTAYGMVDGQTDPSVKKELLSILNSAEKVKEGALHGAVMAEAIDEVQSLTKVGYVDTYDSHGRTPLHLAAKAGKGDIMEVLLSAGADINTHELVSGNTPLHLASAQGYLRIVKDLLCHDADPGARNKKGETAHDLACSLSTATSDRIEDEIKAALQRSETTFKYGRHAILANEGKCTVHVVVVPDKSQLWKWTDGRGNIEASDFQSLVLLPFSKQRVAVLVGESVQVVYFTPRVNQGVGTRSHLLDVWNVVQISCGQTAFLSVAEEWSSPLASVEGAAGGNRSNAVVRSVLHKLKDISDPGTVVFWDVNKSSFPSVPLHMAGDSDNQSAPSTKPWAKSGQKSRKSPLKGHPQWHIEHIQGRQITKKRKKYIRLQNQTTSKINIYLKQGSPPRQVNQAGMNVGFGGFNAGANFAYPTPRDEQGSDHLLPVALPSLSTIDIFLGSSHLWWMVFCTVMCAGQGGKTSIAKIWAKVVTQEKMMVTFVEKVGVEGCPFDTVELSGDADLHSHVKERVMVF
ncbi:unnamed protein product [Discosporangium mesarthrocarpum]